VAEPATTTATPPAARPHRRTRPEPFTRAELLAVKHALSGCMPDEHYAGARSAFQKVEQLLEEARHG
jgi:hypothetical protein